MTALAGLVLTVTNPELKTSAVSNIADFVFIAIPPMVSEVRSLIDRLDVVKALRELSSCRVSYAESA
jgi:hypothetical protein